MMKRLWNSLSAGVFLVTLAVSAIVSVVNPNLLPLGSVVPLTIFVFGLWLIVLAFIKRALGPSVYESPPLMVGGWGILLVGIGLMWLYPSSWLLIMAILILIVGLIAIVYSFMKRA
ncbi:MAG: hypothetical protein HXX80_00100 [Nitrososphaerales archaeon]|nr:hypothetical protein [Nitrososphaerales archaeon]